MSHIDEIAPDIFRISTFVPELNIQFNQFLVRDEEPLLFHTGPRRLFSDTNQAVRRLIDPSWLRYIAFSHFESDECGALGEWQDQAPQATAVCSLVAKVVSVDDVVARRPARALENGQVLETGRLRLRFLATPQVPHAWDAGLLFEETEGVLLCSDLFHQNGDREALTHDDVVGRFKDTLLEMQRGPLAGYLPLTPQTEPTLARLAALRPRVLATMHGSTYIGDGEAAIRDLGRVMAEVLG